MIKLIILVVILPAKNLAFELPENGVWNRVGSINRNMDKSSSPLDDSGLKKIGATVASGMAITSTVYRAIAEGDDLQKKSSDLSKRTRDIRTHAIRVITTPNAANKKAFADSLKTINSSYKLKAIQLSGSEIMGYAKKAFHLVGEFLNQQNFDSDELMLLDQDLMKITENAEQANKAGEEVNEKLESLLEASASVTEANMTPATAQALLQVNDKLEQSLENFKSVLIASLTDSRSKVSTFISDVENEVRVLETNVEKISSDIRSGISAVLLGQIEADTKPARDCYRRLYEKFSRSSGAGKKSNYELLLTPESALSPTEKNLAERLNEYLQHFDTGVQSCLERFRGLYDPARGPPTRPRGLFTKVLERFEFEFNDPKTWTGNKARNELKKFPLMATQLLIQLTNLFIFDAALSSRTNSGKNKKNQVFSKQKNSMMGYLENTELLMKKFNDSFPHCPLSHPLREGVFTHRIYCDRDFLPIGAKKDIPANQFAVSNATIRPQLRISFGPKGAWNLNETEIVDNLLVCMNSLGAGGRYSPIQSGANAFSVYRYGYSLNTDPVFDRAYYNSPEGFDASTQEFRAPEDGLYFFSLTMSRIDYNGFTFQLSLLDAAGKERDQRRLHYLAKDNDINSSHTATVIWWMKRGANAFSVFRYGAHTSTDPVFDKTYYNSPGGFDTSAQEFRATEDGLYFFSLTMSRVHNDALIWKLCLLDATGKERKERRLDFGPHDNTIHSSHTVTVIWWINKDEKVKVKHMKGIAYCTIDFPCVLTGFRLR